MKNILIHFFLLLPFAVDAQCEFTDTVYVCVNDTNYFVNTQFMGSTMQQNGTIFTLEEGNKHYATIPEDYVFWPPYDTFPHLDTFAVHWKSTGTVQVKKTEYNFSGLVYYKNSVYSILDCRKIPPGNDTIVVNNPNNNSGKMLPDGIYVPNAVAPYSSGNDVLYPFVSDDLNIERIEYMAVYNRWGSLVWERRNFLPNTPSEGWLSSNAPVGVYVWVLGLELGGERGLFSGNVTVIK